MTKESAVIAKDGALAVDWYKGVLDSILVCGGEGFLFIIVVVVDVL